jgi:hypothetical protein
MGNPNEGMNWAMVCLAAIVVGLFLLAPRIFAYGPPGNVEVQLSRNGQPTTDAVICVFTSSATQIQQVPPDPSGVVILKPMPQGKYTLKFLDHTGNYYPVVETVDVVEGRLVVMKVELGQGATAGAKPGP